MKPIQTTGILVTRDVRLMDTMNHVMNVLDIHTTVCMDIDKALRAIEKKHYSCMVLDWQSCDQPGKMIDNLRSSKLNKETYILTLVKKNQEFDAAFHTSTNMVCYKSEAYKQSLKYLKPGHDNLPQQRRSSHRHTVQWNARISDIAGNIKDAVIFDVSTSGLSLQTKMPARIEDTMKVSFAVPGEGYRAITATTRVKSCTSEGRIGLQFSFISAAQKTLLEKWLAVNSLDQLHIPTNSPMFDQFSKTA